MTESLQLGLLALDDATHLRREQIARLVPVARQLAYRAGEDGITVANLRLEAVRRGILTGGETGRYLSYLGAVMKKAELTPTGYRRSHIPQSHGNLHRVFVLGREQRKRVGRRQVRLKYMPWFARDYNADPAVKLMTNRQDLWYRRLLEHQWDEGGLPNEPFTWYAFAMPAGGHEVPPDDPEWEGFALIVERQFPVAGDGLRYNSRLEDEYGRQLARYKGQQAGGKRSAETRQQQRLSKSPPSSLPGDLQHSGAGTGTTTQTTSAGATPAGATPFDYLMGVCREVLRSPRGGMKTNGSILRAMLSRGHTQDSIEARIRGLPLVLEGADSLKALWGKDLRDDIAAKAEAAYYRTLEKRDKPRRAAHPADAGNTQPQAVGDILDSLGQCGRRS